jgi:hypothetical protein
MTFSSSSMKRLKKLKNPGLNVKGRKRNGANDKRLMKPSKGKKNERPEGSKNWRRMPKTGAKPG